MGAESKIPADEDFMRALVAARGLERAYALFPDIVAAAFARASRAGGPLPADLPPTTELANAFAARGGARP